MASLHIGYALLCVCVFVVLFFYYFFFFFFLIFFLRRFSAISSSLKIDKQVKIVNKLSSFFYFLFFIYLNIKFICRLCVYKYVCLYIYICMYVYIYIYIYIYIHTYLWYFFKRTFYLITPLYFVLSTVFPGGLWRRGLRGLPRGLGGIVIQWSLSRIAMLS